jgi:hypothetical protein
VRDQRRESTFCGTRSKGALATANRPPKASPAAPLAAVLSALAIFFVYESRAFGFPRTPNALHLIKRQRARLASEIDARVVPERRSWS